MKFVKMHGTGNDYIYVDAFREAVSEPAKLAPAISHRRFGVGGDGLILIKPWEGGDAEMEMYNADGSLSEMCGNGLRCVAKYVHDHYRREARQLRLLTGAGVRSARIERLDAAGNAELVSIDMGEPIFEGLRIPTALDLPRVIDHTLEIEGQRFTFSSVSMGNPHCVIYVDDVAAFPVERVGPKIEAHPLFPRKVNVEFVQQLSSSRVIQRTWERGSGETWACGTGASAVAVIGRVTGRTGADLTIQLTGGELQLHYEGQGTVTMAGPAVEVFRGEWPK